MSALLIVLIILGILLLLPGLFIEALKFLFWIGVILLIIAIIVWLVRYIGGRNRV